MFLLCSVATFTQVKDLSSSSTTGFNFYFCFYLSQQSVAAHKKKSELLLLISPYFRTDTWNQKQSTVHNKSSQNGFQRHSNCDRIRAALSPVCFYSTLKIADRSLIIFSYAFIFESITTVFSMCAALANSQFNRILYGIVEHLFLKNLRNLSSYKKHFPALSALS